MSFVCESVQIIEGIQYGLNCVPFSSYLPPLAITKDESISIAIAVGKICGLLIGYTLISRAIKLA